MTRFLILLMVVIAVYLLPSVVAFKKKHINATAILVLNIFLGWTFIGWVGALVWAFKKSEQ
jgi:hypothetical protein